MSEETGKAAGGQRCPVPGHYNRALLLLAVTLTLDTLFGLAFGLAQHVGPLHGIYCALGVSSTLGCDVTPSRIGGYALMVAMMFTIVPLFASLFAIVTTALTTAHADRNHADLKKHVAEVYHGKPEGGPAGAGQADSGQRVPEAPGGG